MLSLGVDIVAMTSKAQALGGGMEPSMRHAHAMHTPCTRHAHSPSPAPQEGLPITDSDASTYIPTRCVGTPEATYSAAMINNFSTATEQDNSELAYWDQGTWALLMDADAVASRAALIAQTDGLCTEWLNTSIYVNLDKCVAWTPTPPSRVLALAPARASWTSGAWLFLAL